MLEAVLLEKEMWSSSPTLRPLSFEEENTTEMGQDMSNIVRSCVLFINLLWEALWLLVLYPFLLSLLWVPLQNARQRHLQKDSRGDQREENHNPCGHYVVTCHYLVPWQCRGEGGLCFSFRLNEEHCVSKGAGFFIFSLQLQKRRLCFWDLCSFSLLSSFAQSQTENFLLFN